MRKTLLLFAAVSFLGTQLHAQLMRGPWSGYIEHNGVRTTVDLQMEGEDFELHGIVSFPDLGVLNVPLTNIKFDEPEFKMSTENEKAFKFEGTFINGNTLSGSAMINDEPAPVNIIKGSGADRPYPRTQVDNVNFPVIAEEITVDLTDGQQIDGVLTIPKETKDYPLVILIADKGPIDMDYTHDNGHKTFLVIAEHLAQKGIASFRYNKRDFDKPADIFNNQTTENFASDVEDIIKYFKNKKDFKFKKLGLLGLGEGGLIASMVTSKNKNVAFLILMGTPGVKIDKMLLEQNKAMLEASGKSKEEASAITSVYQRCYNILKEESSNTDGREEKLVNAMKPLVKPNSLESLDPMFLIRKAHEMNTPWLINYLKINPATYLEKITIPTLVLAGQNDLEVSGKENKEAIEKALAKAKNKSAQFELIPQANHFFQDSKIGSTFEYKELEQTIAHPTMEECSHFITLLFEQQP